MKESGEKNPKRDSSTPQADAFADERGRDSRPAPLGMTVHSGRAVHKMHAR